MLATGGLYHAGHELLHARDRRWLRTFLWLLPACTRRARRATSLRRRATTAQVDGERNSRCVYKRPIHWDVMNEASAISDDALV